MALPIHTWIPYLVYIYIHMFANFFWNCCSFRVFLPLAPLLSLVGALCALFLGIWSHGNVHMDREIISCVQQQLSLTWYSQSQNQFLKKTRISRCLSVCKDLSSASCHRADYLFVLDDLASCILWEFILWSVNIYERHMLWIRQQRGHF